MKKIILLLIIVISIKIIKAQELDASVEVNYEQLPVAAKERLENFANQVQNYLNNTKFTKGNWEGDRIKCSFNIFFLSASDETTYMAQLVITSQRPIEGTEKNSLILNILDNAWKFKYEKNQTMYFNQTDFEPLVSLLDYYAYIIIGFDLDSYYKLGGSEYFSKALEITVKGANSSFSEGWQSKGTLYNRRGLAENLINAKYQQFRMDYFDYHYNGLDLYESEPETAIKNIVKLIKNLEKVRDQIDTRSVLLKVFFDAKAGEIVEYLKNYSDKTIFDSLKKIDPSHISKYEEAMK